MSDFLLELRSEEIPARMQAKARADLARLFAEQLQAAGLSTEGIETYSTPRRLVLIARGLPEATEAVSEELKGPRANAPEQALAGFLKKTGLTREQLEERDGVLFAKIDKPGRVASEVLAEAIEGIVRNFPWPKSMRWGSGNLRWVRPLHGIVALLGEDIVPVNIDGVTSGAATVGHRFHHPGVITIGSYADYAEKLRACHVIVDHEEREAIIREGAAAAAKAAGLSLVEDEGLVVENAGLTEWPVPLLGRFDPEFLDVPRELIVLTMRTNQKYFACTDDTGALAPAFICTANIDASDGGEAIVEGNRRVLAARLSDARFFWEQDLKVPLEEQAQKLSGIVFHEKLGTVADKVERVAKLARWLVENHIVIPAKAGTQHSKEKLGSRLRGNDEEVAELADQAERAARLAKADLVTGMVGEFPELQGVIGGYIAERQGEPKAIADAIRDHYKPVGQGDDVPISPASVAVALADKLDTLFMFYLIGEYPTGSKDPFALRRAALGIIQLILENRLRMTVGQWSVALHKFSGRWDGDSTPNPRNLLLQFLIDRLKVQQREAGVRHDVIDAAHPMMGLGDIYLLTQGVNSLQAFVETGEGTNLLAGYKRAANILKKEQWDAAAAGGTDVPGEEQALVTALDAAEPKAKSAVEAEDFTAAMAALASLRAPIDAFFDKVTVNDSAKETRARRLSLLARFRDAVQQVADFSKIEG